MGEQDFQLKTLVTPEDIIPLNKFFGASSQFRAEQTDDTCFLTHHSPSDMEKKMQRQLLLLIVFTWFILCAALSLLITGPGHLAGTACIWIVLVNVPFLLKGINRLHCCLNNRACIVRKHKEGRRLLIHLSPWQATVKLPAQRVTWFWDGLFETLGDALRATESTVVISSHLLTRRRAKRILGALPPDRFHCRLVDVPFTPFARAVLQLEILLTQWHRVNVSRVRWSILIIRKKSLNTDK
ncbi:hypothetical protein [Klebsiella pneumoniae]